MRILFLSDSLFTRHEREMIARLAIGLADEGVRVAWGVPADLAERLNNQVLLPVIPFKPTRLGLTPARRAVSLLEEARSVLGGMPDVIHFFGGGIARIGAETARLAGAVPAFEVWRPGLEASIRVALSRIYGAGGDSRGGAKALIVTPDDEIRERMLAAFPSAVVRAIPWGVYPHSEPTSQEGGTVCLMLLGPGRDQRAWAAAFKAAVRTVKASPNLHLFADADTTRRLRLWSHARHAGVLDRLTLIDESEMHRELTLSADLLLQPDARGELHTILLDAMGSGVIVVASADPRSDVLVEGTTARLVVDATEAQWHEAIEMVIHDRAMQRRLIESAKAFVREHHKASRQIASLVDAYEWVGGDAERIEAASVLGPSHG